MTRIFLFVCLITHFGSFALAQEHRESPTQAQANKNSEREHFESGRSLAQQQRYEDAVREFQQAITINSKNNHYYDNLGFCLNQLGRYDDAVEALNMAMSLNPSDAYAYRELAISYCDKKDFPKAVDLLQQSISLNSADSVSHRWLAYALYRAQKYDAAIAAADEALKLNSEDFDANYRRGLSLFKLNRFEEANQSLATAAKIRPNDFNATFWAGMCFVRQRDFKDALPSFEKAHQIKPDDKFAQVELFACYLASNQIEKAASVYPHLLLGISGIFVFVYVVWLAALLPFSLRVRAKTSPGFWFSLAWLGLFLEGQGAFLLLLASLPSLGWHEAVLSGVILSGLPIVIVALTGFARQPWGEPFRWRPRFGDPKLILTSVLSVFAIVLIANGLGLLYGFVTHNPFPVQRTIPLIRNALQVNPAAAWFGVVLVIPCVEEVLFRGLLFAAFQKFWGVTGAILVSSVLFVVIHFQLIGSLILLLLGLILARARLRSGSLGLPIALHALNNAIAMLVLTVAPTSVTN